MNRTGVSHFWFLCVRILFFLVFDLRSGFGSGSVFVSDLDLQQSAHPDPVTLNSYSRIGSGSTKLELRDLKSAF